MYLHSNCHPQAPTWAVYQKDTGVVIITCAICGSIATGVKVARR